MSFYISLAHGQNIKGEFVLNGHVSSVNKGQVFLTYSLCKEDRYVTITDSLKIDNGLFSFRGMINEPRKARLKINSEEISFWIEPAYMDLTWDMNLSEQFELKGSLTNEEDRFLSEHFNQLSAELSEYGSKLKELQLRKDSIPDDADLNHMIDMLYQNTDSLLETQQMAGIHYRSVNPNSFFIVSTIELALKGFPAKWLPVETAKEIYNSLSDELKDSPTGRRVDIILSNAVNTQIGKFAPDFNVPDINGNYVKLSQFRGDNYVFIDAWASWCGPCVQSMPHMKGLYEKYKGKGLVIIAVSRDSDKVTWKNAINKYGISDFNNVLAEQEPGSWMSGYFNEDDILNKYPIMSIPRYFFIDKNGVVIGRWEEYSQENMDAIDLIFKQSFEPELTDADGL
ncbi:TlpA disulfide reductase family protein [Dysgonomonas sp. ZJ279]|uniref:TlpA disulfide reductase family protein n=1 Tax=Dysgonomonas sp. ZJ279 TaxID=2709796 RepID=UPI0013E9F92B|nr:TlpA disulfide reductase family protein [Dysgonomonas sp. ZJ279]